MKNKFLAFAIAVFLGSMLSASSMIVKHNTPNDFYVDFHKQIEEFFNNNHFMGSNFDGAFSSYPKIDMLRDKNSYTVKFELAGMSKKDIRVTISQKNILTVSGIRNEYNKEEKDGVIRQERHFGSFNRSVSLPDDIDKDKIDVKYKDGVLSVKIAIDMKKVGKSGAKVLPVN